MHSILDGIRYPKCIPILEYMIPVMLLVTIEYIFRVVGVGKQVYREKCRKRVLRHSWQMKPTITLYGCNISGIWGKPLANGNRGSWDEGQGGMLQAWGAWPKMHRETGLGGKTKHCTVWA